MDERQLESRGFDVEGWILNRTSFPFSNPSLTTFQWYWNSKNWIVYEDENQNNRPNGNQVPVQIKIKSNSIKIEHNIFSYTTGTKSIPVDVVDVSNCYSNDQHQYLQFNMTARKMLEPHIWQLVNQPVNQLVKSCKSHESKKDIFRFIFEFEKSLHKRIADSSSVQYYRIFGIETFSNNQEIIFVQFYLLERLSDDSTTTSLVQSLLDCIVLDVADSSKSPSKFILLLSS